MKRATRALVCALVLAAAMPRVSLAQTSAPAPVPQPAPKTFHVTVDASALAGLPRRTMSATDEAGHTNSYTGVSLDDVLVRAGAPSGMPVRGKAMLSYVMIGADDGYHVLFTLPELDASFTDHIVLIAEARDGVPLAPPAGPYRLIVPFEKRGGRWVRHVTTIDLLNAPLP